MSWLERASSVSIGRLVLIGAIGFAWLSVMMVIIVGSLAVLTSKNWLPRMMEDIKNRGKEAADGMSRPATEVVVEAAQVAEEQDRPQQ